MSSDLRVFKELASRLGIEEKTFFKALASVSKKYGLPTGSSILIDLSDETSDQVVERGDYYPGESVVVSIPDIEKTDTEQLSQHSGKTLWGLPLLHLHTEYVAKSLIDSIIHGGEGVKMFIPSAIITLAAALEAAIGEATFVKCRELLGHENYRKAANSICKLGPLQRLEALVPLATRGEFVLRFGGNASVETIRSLIPLRNKMMHQNLEFLQFSVVENEEGEGYRLEFPEALNKHQERINLDIEQLKNYWLAYIGLKDSFLRSSDYQEDEYLCIAKL